MEAKNPRIVVVDTWSRSQTFRQLRDGGLRARDAPGVRASDKRWIAHDAPAGPAADLAVLA